VYNSHIYTFTTMTVKSREDTRDISGKMYRQFCNKNLLTNQYPGSVNYWQP